MIKEYRSIQEVAGPLMLVTGVEDVYKRQAKKSSICW